MRPIVTGNRTASFGLSSRASSPGERIIVEGQLKVRPGANCATQPYRESKPGTDTWRNSLSITPSFAM